MSTAPSIQPELIDDRVPAGLRKAAIFVLAVGDEIARELFTRLTEDEIRELGHVAVRLTNVTQREIRAVLGEFRHRFDGGFVPTRGAGGMFHLMVEGALGRDRASALFPEKEEVVNLGEDPYELCRSVEPETLANLIREEHPQTIAIVLSSIGAEGAGKVLDEFDPEVASDIVYRLAHLDAVPDDVKREIGASIAAEIAQMDQDPALVALQTEKVTVDVMKALPRERSDELFKFLEERDEEFAKDMRSKIFTFDDLGGLDPRSMQRLLREVDSKALALSMKGANEQIVDLVYSAMSSRAAEMLKDDIDAMGPTRRADVEDAQKSILEIAAGLEEQGIITIPRGGDSGLV